MAELDHPVFDLSNLSWRESKMLALLQLRMRQQQDADSMERAFAEIDGFMARVLVSVPRAWLVTDAPPDLDWHDPESLNWLRGDKFRFLVQALATAQEPENAAKN